MQFTGNAIIFCNTYAHMYICIYSHCIYVCIMICECVDMYTCMWDIMFYFLFCFVVFCCIFFFSSFTFWFYWNWYPFNLQPNYRLHFILPERIIRFMIDMWDKTTYTWNAVANYRNGYCNSATTSNGNSFCQQQPKGKSHSLAAVAVLTVVSSSCGNNIATLLKGRLSFSLMDNAG